MGTFYIDYVNGSDATRATFLNIQIRNNGSGKVAVYVPHTLSTGDRVSLSATGVSYYNTLVSDITVINSSHFDLDNSVYTEDTIIGTATVSGGRTWADAWKTFNGADATRILPGDIIRIAKSPDPVSVGQNATWTGISTTQSGGGLEPTKSIVSSTNTTPIKMTVTNHGYSDGDVVQIVSHTVNTNAFGVWQITNITQNTFDLVGTVGNGVGGASGTVRRINAQCVVLTEPVTKTIDECHTGWSCPGTTGNTIAYYQTATHTRSTLLSITMAASTTPGIIARKSFSSTLDLSDYNQISFIMQNTGAISSSNPLRIKFYSDTAWTNEVENLQIESQLGNSIWHPVTIDKGSALSNNINSMAIYSDTAITRSLWIGNFVACKNSSSNDSITFDTLISKSNSADGGTEGWYTIEGIFNKIILLDACNYALTSHRGYSGTSETVPLYKKETIHTPQTIAATSSVQEIVVSGTQENPIQFIGGYNTNTNEIDGETCFDGRNKISWGICIITKSYITIQNISSYRYGYGLISYTGSNIGNNFYINNCFGNYTNALYFVNQTNGILSIKNAKNNSVGPLISTSSNCQISIDNSDCAGGAGLIANLLNSCNITIGSLNNNLSSGWFGTVGYECYNNKVTITNCNSNGTDAGITLFGNNNTFYLTNCNYNALYGVNFGVSSNNNIIGMNSSGNGTASINTTEGYNYLNRCIIEESVEFAGAANYKSVRIFSTKHDNIENNHYIYRDNGYIITSNSIKYNDTNAISWRLCPTSSLRDSFHPLDLKIASVLCCKNKQVTISAYVKKSHATYIGASLYCMSHQIAGITTDLETTKPDNTDWEQLSITFTPTETGVVEIEAHAWYISDSTTESVYIDDISIL